MRTRALAFTSFALSLWGCSDPTPAPAPHDAGDATTAPDTPTLDTAASDGGLTCPAPESVTGGMPCAVSTGVGCPSTEACRQCGAFAYRTFAPTCVCVAGTWSCSHTDCGPMAGCGSFSDPACTVPGPCDAGTTDAARDASPEAAADVPRDAPPATDARTSCPQGTCIPPSGTQCEPPTGPTGNACCMCGADGLCSSPCRCAAPDTPIATPDGERPIASLREGDLVYSMHRGVLQAVPLRAVQRVPVRNHRVMRVTLGDGATLFLLAGRPPADGRSGAGLSAGSWLGGREVTSAELVDYPHDATYDILPESDTATYLAGGALIGSTMAPIVTRVDIPVCRPALVVR